MKLQIKFSTVGYDGTDLANDQSRDRKNGCTIPLPQDRLSSTNKPVTMLLYGQGCSLVVYL